MPFASILIASRVKKIYQKILYLVQEIKTFLPGVQFLYPVTNKKYQRRNVEDAIFCLMIVMIHETQSYGKYWIVILKLEVLNQRCSKSF